MAAYYLRLTCLTNLWIKAKKQHLLSDKCSTFRAQRVVSVIVTVGPVCPSTKTPRFMVYGKTPTHVNSYLAIIQSWGCLEAANDVTLYAAEQQWKKRGSQFNIRLKATLLIILYFIITIRPISHNKAVTIACLFYMDIPGPTYMILVECLI